MNISGATGPMGSIGSGAMGPIGSGATSSYNFATGPWGTTGAIVTSYSGLRGVSGPAPSIASGVWHGYTGVQGCTGPTGPSIPTRDFEIGNYTYKVGASNYVKIYEKAKDPKYSSLDYVCGIVLEKDEPKITSFYKNGKYIPNFTMSDVPSEILYNYKRLCRSTVMG